MINVFLHTFKLFTWDLFLSLGYWPIWWYSSGLVDFFKFVGRQLKQSFRNQALDILIRSWFKPMYAQYDWQGRLISFIFRTLMIAWRLAFFLVWAVVLIVLACVWIGVWPLALFMIIKILF